MRYFFSGPTLFLRGRFAAASTGAGGGCKTVSTIFNHTVAKDWNEHDPLPLLQRVAEAEGFFGDFFGLLTAVGQRHCCICQYDEVTAFVTAGVSVRPGEAGTINTIVASREGLAPGALLGAIVTATEAKTEALRVLGHAFTGTPTDAVVIACEGEVSHEYTGRATPIGERIRACVLQGVQESLRRSSGEVVRSRPSFFIYSRHGGGHWVEWNPEGCPYYPCHFEGQRCDFCYCPFYPCMDESLGDLIEGTDGRKVWACTRCRLLHEEKIADYAKKNPEASLQELKHLRERS